MSMSKIKCRSFASSKSQAYFYTENGPPANVLKFGSVPNTGTSDGKENFEVIESPINPSDINMIEGTYPVSPSPFPKIAGSECLGYLHDRKSGRKVLAIPRRQALGTWRRRFNVDSSDLFELPSSFEPHPLLSAISVNPSTAYRLLRDFSQPSLAKGDVVVQNAANSVVGKCVIQLARIMGCRTVNIVREREGMAETKAELKRMGADLVVTDKEATENPKGFFGGLPKARLALNAVGGVGVDLLARNLMDGSAVVTYGGMSKMPFRVSAASQIFRDIRFRGFWVSRWYSRCSDQEKLEMIREIYGYMRSKEMVFAMKRIPFDDAEAVMRAIVNPPKNQKSVISMIRLFE